VLRASWDPWRGIRRRWKAGSQEESRSEEVENVEGGESIKRMKRTKSKHREGRDLDYTRGWPRLRSAAQAVRCGRCSRNAGRGVLDLHTHRFCRAGVWLDMVGLHRKPDDRPACAIGGKREDRWVECRSPVSDGSRQVASSSGLDPPASSGGLSSRYEARAVLLSNQVSNFWCFNSFLRYPCPQALSYIPNRL
jgi:hypothetical protein